jgi:hypothetical protein
MFSKYPMKLSIDESKLYSEDKKNPTIQLLLEINRQQAEFIQQLKDEINRLKKHPRKPKIKPSNLEKKRKIRIEKRRQKSRFREEVQNRRNKDSPC